MQEERQKKQRQSQDFQKERLNLCRGRYDRQCRIGYGRSQKGTDYDLDDGVGVASEQWSCPASDVQRKCPANDSDERWLSLASDVQRKCPANDSDERWLSPASDVRWTAPASDVRGTAPAYGLRGTGPVHHGRGTGPTKGVGSGSNYL